MICGNKTDRCPTCGKYVRRAIFAYHYENNCADLDVLTTDDQTSQTVQHSGNFCGSLLLISNCLLERPPRVSMKCEYCEQNYDRADSKAHKVKT